MGATIVIAGPNHRAGAGLWIVVDDHGTAQRKPPRDDPRIAFGVRTQLDQTVLSKSRPGANKSDGLRRSSRGHLCSLCGRDYLPFLSFLSFFLPANLLS